GAIIATAGRDLTAGAVTITAGGNLAGNVGRNATFNGTTLTAATASVTGGGAGSTLTMNYALGSPTVWRVTGANSGQLANSGAINIPAGLGFTAFGNLTGGNGDDQFRFNDAGAISGTINGQGGNNTLDFSPATLPRTFNITASNAGNVAGVVGSFTSIQNLIGGNGNDRFVLTNGVGVSGMIDGGPGTDTLDYSNYSAANPITVALSSSGPNGFNGTATNIAGGIFNIDALIGGASNSDVLTVNGTPGNDTFLITSNE